MDLDFYTFRPGEFRRNYSLFCWPFLLDSPSKPMPSSFASWVYGPMVKSFNFAKCIYLNTVSFVIGIFFHANKSAVIRRITTIIIDSIKANAFSMFERLSPFIEWLKLKPFIANSYSSCAIVFKGSIIRIKAPLNHIIPNSKKSRITLPMFKFRMHFRNIAFFIARNAASLSRALPSFYGVFRALKENFVTSRTNFFIFHGKLLAHATRLLNTQNTLVGEAAWG